jgi:hypothetical protein
VTIHADIQYLKGRIEALQIEYPELADDDDLRADVFEGETALPEVLAKLVNTTLEAETMSDAIKSRAAELATRKARFDRKANASRGLILDLMERANFSKLQLTEATLSVRQIAPSPIVVDETALPDNCVRIERKPDMKAIKAEIEGGREVQGVAMSNGKASLTIRTK